MYVIQFISLVFSAIWLIDYNLHLKLKDVPLLGILYNLEEKKLVSLYNNYKYLIGTTFFMLTFH